MEYSEKNRIAEINKAIPTETILQDINEVTMVTNDPICWKWKVKLFDKHFAFYIEETTQFKFIHIGWLFIVRNKRKITH